MIRIEYTQTNGYRCGCCRQEWQKSKDFSSKEEAAKFLAEIKFNNDTGGDDMYVNTISIVEDIELEMDEKEYARLKQARLEGEILEKQREKEESLKRKEAQFAALKAELGK